MLARLTFLFLLSAAAFSCEITDSFCDNLTATGLTLSDVMVFSEAELDELMRDEFQMKISHRHAVKKWIKTQDGYQEQHFLVSVDTGMAQTVMQVVGCVVILSLIVSIDLYRRKYAAAAPVPAVEKPVVKDPVKAAPDRRSEAGKTIQRFMKCQLFRSRINHTFKRRQEARFLLQNTARGMLARMSYRRHISACVAIQKFVKKMISRNALTKKRTTACILIQRFIRNASSRELVTNKRTSACTTIQRVARGMLARKLYLKNKNRHSACVVIQKLVRGMISRKLTSKVRDTCDRQHSACITIQRVVRGVISRKLSSEMMKQHKACITIQRVVKGMISRKLSSTIAKRRTASITIQRVARGMLSRMAVQRKLRTAACVKLQTLARCVHSKVVLSQLRSEKEQSLKVERAVVCIQRCVRKWLQETEIAKTTIIRPRPSIAIHVAQQHASCVAIQRFVKERFLEPRHNAASKIQAIMKSHVQRRKYHSLKQTANSAATIIQRLARSFFARKVMLSARREIKSCIAIQRFIRERNARRARFAVVIQRAFRKKLSCRKQNHCAVLLQSNFRMLLVRNTFKKQIAAAILIQRWSRSTLFARKQVAAATLQKFFKKCLLCKKEKTLSAQSAILIQKTFRGYFCAREFHKIKRSCVVIQKIARGNAARAFCANRTRSIIKCQSFSRMLLAKNQKRQILTTTNAALTIQKNIRGYMSRKYFRKCRSAAISLQTFSRARTARLSFLKTRCLVVVAQAAVRRCLAIRLKKSLLAGCVTIQGFSKIIGAKKTLAGLAKQRHACRTVQRWWRGCLGRNTARQLLLAYVRIQSAWRRVLAVRRFAKLTAKKRCKSFEHSDPKTKAKLRKILVEEKRQRTDIEQLGLSELRGKISDEKRRRKAHAVESRVEEEKKRRFFSKATKKGKKKPAAKTASVATSAPVSRRRKAAPTVVEPSISPESARTKVDVCLDPVPIPALPFNHTPHKEVCDIIRESDSESSDFDSDCLSSDLVEPSVAVVIIQKAVRGFLSRVAFRQRQQKQLAATTIQRVYRGYQSRSIHRQQSVQPAKDVSLSEHFAEQMTNVMIELDFSDDDHQSDCMDSPLAEPVNESRYNSFCVDVERTTTIQQLRESRCTVEKFGSLILNSTEITDTESELTECSTPGCIELCLPETPRLSVVDELKAIAEDLPEDEANFQPRLSALSNSVGRMSIGALADMLNDVPPGTPRDSNRIVEAVLECCTPRDDVSKGADINDLEKAIATGDVNYVIACLSATKESSPSPRHI
eukprot:TRINITY_DN2266_c0_g1_i1.p1 TRINITY_DN2266_c0_g1~~TRINITY_DN2266_c0_g1_i1.p1  ORF type:complete len:1287 (+),score=237.92 TRINITY_DN2266_c0_g1_i1:55-3861(+)